jgi:hypothetical protein
MGSLAIGDEVWWHDPGAEPNPSRLGRVDHVEPDGRVGINPGPDIPTVWVAPLYVHRADQAFPVDRCAFCLSRSSH